MSPQEQPVNVRLLIFSGRPDPEWNLAEEAVQPLAERVRVTLSGERVGQAPAGGLGYRGFLVHSPTKLYELPEEFTVFRGVLMVSGNSQAQSWRDTGQVEGFLLDDAHRRGLGELLDALGGPGPDSPGSIA